MKMQIWKNYRIWKLFRFCGPYWSRYVLGIFFILVLGFYTKYAWACRRLILLGIGRPRFVCINFVGGIGSQMFHFAYGYSVSRNRNLDLVVPRDSMLLDKFYVAPNPLEQYGMDESVCYKCFKRVENKLNCSCDLSLENLPDTDLSFIGYYHSWKDWIEYEDNLRKIFRFKEHILRYANKQLRKILQTKGMSEKHYQNTTLVGVHIRNGDFNPRFGDDGFNTAPKSYILEAMQYFRNRYRNPLFVVATNQLQWTIRNFGSIKDVYIVRNNQAVSDMCLLSLTNHTIMTTGTFGWMIGWLTRGTTLFYKYPYRKGSEFSKHFHSNFSDYFYPGWIGLGKYTENIN